MRNNWLLSALLAILTITPVLRAQQDDVQQQLQQVRQELIAEIDHKLQKLRQELIAEIDRKLRFAKPAGFLGVSLKSITPGLRTLLDLAPNEGVLITHVMPESPAAQAGLKEMDIILAIDGRLVSKVDEANALISESGAGSEVTLSILHRRERKAVVVKLGIRRKTSEEKSSVLENLLGNKGLDQKSLQEMEQKLKRFLGEMTPEDREMMENMQKRVREQMESFLKDPKLREDMEKQFESVLEQLGDKNMEDLLKDLLPQKSPEKDAAKNQTKDEIDSLLDDLLEENKPATTKPSQAYLGIEVLPIPAAVREKENFFEDYGVLISQVDSQSPAAMANIKKWDILLYVEKRQISSVEQAREILAGYRPGDKAAFILLANGEQRTVMVTFSEKPN